jgi:uncharacterized cupin superfamily protein
MDYETASTETIDSVIPEEAGGMWFFREPLGCENLGMTLLQLEPGQDGKPHDHADDRQEEVYLVVDGEVTVRVGGDETPTDELTLADGEALRVGPDTRRTLSNTGDERARIAIAGAP